MLVNNFKEEQGELVMGVDVPLFNRDINLPQKPFLAVDILNANGADNNFVNRLLKKILTRIYFLVMPAGIQRVIRLAVRYAAH